MNALAESPFSSDDALYRCPGSPRTIPTWGAEGELNRQTVESLMRATDRFRQRGLEWKFAREQEFELAGTPNAATVEIHRAALLTHPNLDAAAREFAGHCSAQELLVIELMATLPDIIPPRAPDAIRDPHGVFELDLAMADPVEDIRQFHRFHETLSQLAEAYGFNVSLHKRDINVSLWDRNRNVNLMDWSAGQPETLRICDGIVQAVEEAAPVFFKSKRFRSDDPIHVRADRQRSSPVRIVGDTPEDSRIEIRTNTNLRAGEHPALENLLILSGVETALDNARTAQPQGQWTSHVVQPFETKSRFENISLFGVPEEGKRLQPDELFFTIEMLNGAKREADGTLRFDPKDWSEYERHVVKELGVTSSAQELRDWFDGIRMIGSHLSWPDARYIAPDRWLDLSNDLERIRPCEPEPSIRHDGTALQPGMQAAIEGLSESEILKNALGNTASRMIVGQVASKWGCEPPRASVQHERG